MFDTPEILKELRTNNRLLEENNRLLRCLLNLAFEYTNRVTGGVMTRIGDTTMGTPTPALGPIVGGTNAKFAVAPEFSGDAFTTAASQVTVTSSDPVNFPAVVDPTDPTGLTIDVSVPAGAAVEPGVVLTWQYLNLDGTESAPVTGTYDIATGQVSDVTGGTFTRIA